MIKIVNKRTHKPSNCDFYIGRGSPLGNPWTHIKGRTKALYVCQTREESIANYKVWLNHQVMMGNEKVLDALRKIYRMAKSGDVNLVCYCTPLACHGQVIKQFVESHLQFINNETSSKS